MEFTRTKNMDGSYRIARKFAYFPFKRVAYNSETANHYSNWLWLRYAYCVEIYKASSGGWVNSGIGGVWPFDSLIEAEKALENRRQTEQKIEKIRSEKTFGIYNKCHLKVADLPENAIDEWSDIICHVRQKHDISSTDKGWRLYIYIPDDGPDIPCEVFHNLGWGLGKVNDSIFAFVAYVYPPSESAIYQPKFRLPDSL